MWRLSCACRLGWVILVGSAALVTGCAQAVREVGAPGVMGQIYAMGDKTCEIRMAPQFGRVVHFSAGDSPNLIVTSIPSPGLGLPENMGGDVLRLWPMKSDVDQPDSDAIYAGPCVQRILRKPAGIEWRTAVREDSGLSAMRTITIDKGRIAHHYRLQRDVLLTSCDPNPAQVDVTKGVAAWAMMRIPTTPKVYVRLLNDAPVMRNEKNHMQTERVNARWVCVVPPETSGRIGLPGEIIAAVFQDRVLVIQRVAGNDDPNLERQSAAQIYYDVDKSHPGDSYIETGFIGPTKVLNKGESTSLYTEWRILTPADFDRLMAEE